MIRAFRDTWELGIHSYLTYLRDRLLLAHELLNPSGSCFVQISDENIHHVREVLDDVFGTKNFVSVIAFQKTTSSSGDVISSVADFLLWYARDAALLKSRPIFLSRAGEGWVNYDFIRLPDGTHKKMTKEEKEDWSRLPLGA